MLGLNLCYGYLQAAEKALKAMWFNIDANNRFIRASHQLCDIASGLPGAVPRLASEMVAVVGQHTRMRYPDQHGGDQIPATEYLAQHADKCLKLAEKMVEAASEFVE